jgi:hypothetical protein
MNMLPRHNLTLSTALLLLAHAPLLGLCACASDDDAALDVLEEGSSEELEPVDSQEDDDENAGDDPDDDPGDDECDGDTSGDDGHDDDSECPEAEPPLASVEVASFAANEDGDLEGSIRFETNSGRTGEIRMRRGGIASVEFRVDDQLISTTMVNHGALPGGASGTSCAAFPADAMTTVHGDAPLIAGAAEDGTLALFDDAVAQAMETSPEFHELMIGGLAGEQADLGCPEWCQIAGAGAGASIGGALAGLGGFTPPAIIGGGIIGAVAGTILGFDCIEALCD